MKNDNDIAGVCIEGRQDEIQAQGCSSTAQLEVGGGERKAGQAEKRCCRCRAIKPLNAFRKRKIHRDGLSCHCKDCGAESRKRENAQRRLRRRANPEKERYIDLWRHYRLTKEDHISLLKAQDGKCAICRGTEVKNGKHKHLHVDHCHKTGVVRGLLCGQCNHILGHCRDSVEILSRTILYLSETKRSEPKGTAQ
jgi:hypothetical protein